MGLLLASIITLITFFICIKKQADKENEQYCKRMQEVIKNAIKQALNEREEEFINNDTFGPFDNDEYEMSNEEKMKSYIETADDNHYRAMTGMERPTNENLDSYEHLEEKRKAVEETINSIVDVIE